MKTKLTGKKFLAVCLAISGILTLSFAANAEPPAEEPIKVTIDGVLQSFDQPPVIISDRTMAPMRGIFEALGAEIDWDGETRTVTGTKGDISIKLTIDVASAFVNGESVELDQAPVIVNDRTLVPVRFISESLGIKVDWDAATRTVIIGSAAAPAPTPTAAPTPTPTPAPTPTPTPAPTPTPTPTPTPQETKPSGKNLVSNPGMETSKLPIAGTYEATFKATKNEAHTGAQSLQVVGTASYGSIQIPVALKLGQEYYYSVWCKLGDDATATLLRIVMQYHDASGSQKQEIIISSPPLSKEEWVQASGVFTIPKESGATDTTVVLFLDSPSGAGTYYIDDIEVIENK